MVTQKLQRTSAIEVGGRCWGRVGESIVDCGHRKARIEKRPGARSFEAPLISTPESAAMDVKHKRRRLLRLGQIEIEHVSLMRPVTHVSVCRDDALWPLRYVLAMTAGAKRKRDQKKYADNLILNGWHDRVR